MDNILMYSWSLAEHRLSINCSEKGSFYQSSIQLFGYGISKESIQMDEGNVFKSSPGQLPKQSKSSKYSSVLTISVLPTPIP